MHAERRAKLATLASGWAVWVAAVACSAEPGAVTGAADAGVSTPDARIVEPGPDAAAPSPADAGPQDPDAAVDGPDASSPPDTGPAVSATRRLRFKRFDQLQLELERVLALGPTEVCRELDRFDCTSDVHRVALGGSDPYLANVYEPASEPPLNAPLAWERVVLTACAERVDRDLASPTEAAWLKEVDVDQTGALDPASPAVEHAVRTIYREGLLRDPSGEEVGAWRDEYRSIADAGAEHPARSWARVLCGAVLTSGEFVFY